MVFFHDNDTIYHIQILPQIIAGGIGERTQKLKSDVFFKSDCNNLVQIKVVQETILNGFEKMPQALIGLFNSTAGNLGKVIVKAYPD